MAGLSLAETRREGLNNTEGATFSLPEPIGGSVLVEESQNPVVVPAPGGGVDQVTTTLAMGSSMILG